MSRRVGYGRSPSTPSPRLLAACGRMCFALLLQVCSGTAALRLPFEAPVAQNPTYDVPFLLLRVAVVSQRRGRHELSDGFINPFATFSCPFRLYVAHARVFLRTRCSVCMYYCCDGRWQVLPGQSWPRSRTRLQYRRREEDPSCCCGMTSW